MAQSVSIKVIREFETQVPIFPSLCRFTTVVGAMLDVRTSGGDRQIETYTCPVGPRLNKDEFIGASCLPSIGRLQPTTAESAQCVLESWDTEWNDDSGQVELRVTVSGAGGPAKLEIMFSVTVLAGS
jgi:hypothetical protein